MSPTETSCIYLLEWTRSFQTGVSQCSSLKYSSPLLLSINEGSNVISRIVSLAGAIGAANGNLHLLLPYLLQHLGSGVYVQESLRQPPQGSPNVRRSKKKAIVIHFWVAIVKT